VLLEHRTLEGLLDCESRGELVEQAAVVVEQHLGLGLGLLEQPANAAVGVSLGLWADVLERGLLAEECRRVARIEAHE